MFRDPFIIAEIGHNHMGDVDICKKMFAEAKRCGASAVKLQKRDNKSLFTKAFYNKPYDNPNSYGATYGEHREALEFGRDEYLELKTYAKALGIIFFSTPFDFKSVDFLEELDMPLYKIASADCTNTPLIKYVVETGKPVIVSTGGTSWREIDLVEELLNDNCAILHCVSSYPTQPEEMNLNIIPMMIERYDLEIGLSDHYNGICMAEAAYVLGATIIEKHFTLNHSWRGSDHALSLEPQGLESLVNNINRIKLALGDTEKYVLPSEKAAISKLGKSIWPKYHIKAGTLLGECDFDIKSPGGGLPPYRIYDVEGKVSVNDLSTCNPLQEGDYK